MSNTKVNSINIVENNPNPSRLVESLRHLGYDNYYAIGDLVDNSIDAEATKIILEINSHQGQFQILIADNGSGMEKDVLDQALRLGSNTERDVATDLGKFGMGLCTASMSIARNLTVLTRTTNKKILKSSFDLDDIVKTNKFIKYLGECSDEEAQLFNKFIKDSGTLIILSKCDLIKNTNITQLTQTLKKRLGQIYRYFLQSKLEITVNNDKVLPVDPLMRNEKAEIFSDETYPIEIGEDGRKTTVNIRVVLVILPNFGLKENRDRGINQRNQGFYILRNNRELLTSMEIGSAYEKHNSMNRFRGEIFFSGELDKYLGVHFTKRSLDIDKEIMDKLHEELKGQLKTLRNRLNTQQNDELSEDVDHENVEKIITQKSHLLIQPTKEEKEEISGKKEKEGTSIISKEKAKELLRTRSKIKCLFRKESLKREGLPYYVEQVGQITVVTYNIDHPFYEDFVLANKDNREMADKIDLLIYSFALAELKIINKGNEELIDSYKSIWAANLRTLLA